MSTLYVARRKSRRGLLLSMNGSRENPNLLFPLDGVERSELNELIRAILAKQGVTDEAEIQAVVERAENDSEIRIKIAEVKKEVKRLMGFRAQGLKLMQRGYRRWAPAFFRPI